MNKSYDNICLVVFHKTSLIKIDGSKSLKNVKNILSVLFYIELSFIIYISLGERISYYQAAH